VRHSDSSFVPTLKTTTTMKKLLCILAGTALLGACEQKTEVAPAAPAEKKTETNTTIVNPASAERTKETTNTLTTTQQPSSVDTKTEKETTTTTTSSPNP
jgi:PBP1b-binding outer membrane lipoprotein LpoB